MSKWLPGGKISDHSVEQAVRKSHCSHPDSKKMEHECHGEMHVTRGGVRLECKICGSDNQNPILQMKEYGLDAKNILEAAGIEMYKLSRETQIEVLKAVEKAVKFNREY